ncbi:MAG: HipA domain-containing protein [Candidatus Sericytochromatia bacterium]
MKENFKTILVYADWVDLKKTFLMGFLKITNSRNKEIFSFEYSQEWLNSGFSHLIDPDLQLYSGTQYLNNDKNNFGIFLDSSPDRWGRLLMRRREVLNAKIEQRKVKTLLESDYLLGVYDGYRMGAIRFKDSENGNFLNDDKKLATPPWTLLRELEFASLELEKDDSTVNPDYIKWLNMLIAPGSSLGGARPKAGVIDNKNNLWIAKFPSKNDDKDIGAWEMLVNQIALESGLNVSESMVKKFTSKYHTYLTKRFDRNEKGQRIHFASAMTLLGYTDGNDFNDGVSYLELAEFLIRYGANVNKDLEELWKRIVFNICVSNTDDHLRNHGFLLTEKGWVLSPAYDINPIETGTGLKLNISEDDNSLDLDLALEVIDYFRVDYKKAKEIIEIIQKNVSTWNQKASNLGISRNDQELMFNAFRV